jgi:hypothetical protein
MLQFSEYQTSWQIGGDVLAAVYVINFFPASIGIHPSIVTWFLKVASSRAESIFAEKGHMRSVRFGSVRILAYSQLSNNTGWILTCVSPKIVIAHIAKNSGVGINADDSYGADVTRPRPRPRPPAPPLPSPTLPRPLLSLLFAVEMGVVVSDEKIIMRMAEESSFEFKIIRHQKATLSFITIM